MLIQGAQGGDNKTWGNKNPLAAPTTHDNLMAATEGWSSIRHSHLHINDVLTCPPKVVLET